MKTQRPEDEDPPRPSNFACSSSRVSPTTSVAATSNPSFHVQHMHSSIFPTNTFLSPHQMLTKPLISSATMATLSLTVVCALLAAILIAATTTSAYRTTITTVEIDEDTNPRQSEQRCREQARGQRLNHCQDYLREQTRRGVIMLRGEENTEHLRECCQQLQQVDEQCRCEALREVIQQQQQQGRMQGREVSQMMESARNLPALCGMRPQRCEMRSPWL